MDHLFLVGTEEGVIRKCSTAYSAEYLASFLGNAMATYAARWNCRHPRAFLSASADWTVKLWDDAVPQVGSKPAFQLLTGNIDHVMWSHPCMAADDGCHSSSPVYGIWEGTA